MEKNFVIEENHIKTNSDDLTYSEEENSNKRKNNLNNYKINKIVQNMEEAINQNSNISKIKKFNSFRKL